MEARVADAQGQFNRILQGDRSSCPVPDDRMSSDCYVGLATELNSLREQMKRLQAVASTSAAARRNASVALTLANANLASFRTYTAIASMIKGLTGGAAVFAAVLLLAWIYARDRRLASRIVIATAITLAAAVVVGIVIGLREYTSPRVTGVSCKALDSVGVGGSCVHDAAARGATTALLTALAGIGITISITAWASRTRGGLRREQGAPDRVPAQQPETDGNESSSKGARTQVTLAQAPSVTTSGSAEIAADGRAESSSVAIHHDPPKPPPWSDPKWQERAPYTSGNVDVFTRGDGSSRSITRGFNYATLLWGLIFGVFWPLSHRLWKQSIAAAAALIGSYPAGLVAASDSPPDQAASMAAAFIFGTPVVVAIWFGAYGNTWRRERAVKDGFVAPDGAPPGSSKLFPL